MYTKTLVSGITDISSPEQGSHFTSNTQDRVSTIRTPLITPAEVINLPKGQAFALLEGGQLWKIRMPLPAADDDDLMPASLQKIADDMRKHYRTSESWWSAGSMPSDSQADLDMMLNPAVLTLDEEVDDDATEN